jgi:hypothetical protein
LPKFPRVSAGEAGPLEEIRETALAKIFGYGLVLRAGAVIAIGDKIWAPPGRFSPDLDPLPAGWRAAVANAPDH